jgi:hypothetical protein
MAALVSLPAAEHLAVLRTFVGCSLAAGLAWSGSRWRFGEMIWLAWAALFLLAVKLLLEDLRHGYLAFSAVSIFLYAVTLLMVARLVRPKLSGTAV